MSHPMQQPTESRPMRQDAHLHQSLTEISIRSSLKSYVVFTIIIVLSGNRPYDICFCCGRGIFGLPTLHAIKLDYEWPFMPWKSVCNC